MNIHEPYCTSSRLKATPGNDVSAAKVEDFNPLKAGIYPTKEVSCIADWVIFGPTAPMNLCRAWLIDLACRCKVSDFEHL